MATPPPNLKISDCETVLKKQAAAFRAATAALKGSVKMEDKTINGKKVKMPIAQEDAVKKAIGQYDEARKQSGYHYEQMKKWFDQGKNAARSDFEKAAAEWATAKKEVDKAVDPTDFGMIKLLKDANAKKM